VTRQPRPWKIDSHGHLIHRASDQIIGRVWLESGSSDTSGWYAENETNRWGPYGTRTVAATQAYWDSGYAKRGDNK